MKLNWMLQSILLATAILVVGCQPADKVADETGSSVPAVETNNSDLESSESENKSLGEVDTSNLTAEEKFEAIEDDYALAMKKFREAIDEAAEKDRRKVYDDLYPKSEDYVARYMELAKAHPEDDVAVDSLVWVANRSRGDSQKDAMDSLFENHLDSNKMKDICFSLMYAQPGDKSAHDRLQKLREQSPHDDVVGMATYALATFLQRSEKKMGTEPEEYIELFKTVANDYADVEIRGRKIGTMAEGSIFAFENLSIGKVAPDIEGKDLDGVEFKLSEYRGKVVVIDFWGDW